MRRLLTAALLCLTALPAAASPPLQPGLYEISMQMVMKGMPMQMPVTPQDIASGNAYASGKNSKDCKISNLRQSGNTVSYDFSCAMEGRRGLMVGHSSGTSTATGYDILMNGHFVPAVEGMSAFNQKMSGRRLGDCK
jgi:hypothetical protein